MAGSGAVDGRFFTVGQPLARRDHVVGAAGEVVLSDDAYVSGEVFVEPFGIVTLGGSYYF